MPPTRRTRDHAGTARARAPGVAGRRVDQVVAVHRHRRRERAAVAHDREPAVVGHVERLVGVGGPRVRLRQPVDGVAQRGEAAAQSPKAPSTCAQAPCSWAAATHSANGSKSPEWTLPAWSATTAGPSPSASAVARASGRIRPCPSTGTTIGSPRPRKRSGRSTDGCRSGPHEDPHLWQPGETRPYVVPRPVQDLVASGCQAREVGHRRAGHEPDGALRRQPEQVEDPAARDLLDRGRCRGQGPEPGVLVPCATSASRRRGPPAAPRRSPCRRSDRTASRPDPARTPRPAGRRPRRPGSARPAVRPGGAPSRRCRPTPAPTGRRATPASRQHGAVRGRGLQTGPPWATLSRSPPGADNLPGPSRPRDFLENPRGGARAAVPRRR